VHGVASRDCRGNEHLLGPAKVFERELECGNTRRALGYRQRVVGHALDFAHDETEHSVGKQRGQQRQRITGVLGTPGHTTLRRSPTPTPRTFGASPRT